MAIVREQVSIDNEKRRLSQLELDQRAEGVVRYVSRLHLAYDIAVCCLLQNRNLTSQIIVLAFSSPYWAPPLSRAYAQVFPTKTEL